VPSKPETAAFCCDFEPPARFGGGKGSSGLEQAVMAASSDSIFAAVCVEWLHLYGEAALETLIDEVRDRRLLFSSLMPWCQPQSGKVDREYFLPRPLLSGQAEGGTKNSQIKKQLKQLPYIAVSGMADYLEFVRTGQGNRRLFESASVQKSAGTGSTPGPAVSRSLIMSQPGNSFVHRQSRRFEAGSRSWSQSGDWPNWLVQAQDSG
jgi:CRISPR type III-A-associated RAMP protein Csm4